MPHRRNAQHFRGWLQTVTLFSMFHHDCTEKYDYHDCNDYYCDRCLHPFFTSVLFFFRTGSPAYGWSFMEDLYIADTEIIFYVPDTLFFSLPYKTKARELSETSTVRADQAANADVLQMHLFHSHRLSHPAPSVYVLIRSGSPALPRVNAQQTAARYQRQTENISGSAEKARRSAASTV